jgi:DnaJ-class molecular chaperone
MAQARKLDKTHYQILGIDEKATLGEITQSFRTLSRKFHPDKDPEKGEEYKEIVRAYEILGDADKRREYDATLPTEAKATFSHMFRSPVPPGQPDMESKQRLLIPYFRDAKFASMIKEKIFTLDLKQSMNLSSAYPLVTSGHLNFEEALGLTEAEKKAIDSVFNFMATFIPGGLKATDARIEAALSKLDEVSPQKNYGNRNR